MARVTDHEPGCPLSAAPWLVDAARADASVDRAATGALTEALADLPEMDVLADARLAAVLRRVAPSEEDHRLAWCTCRRRRGQD
jgi:hypothetical protein